MCKCSIKGGLPTAAKLVGEVAVYISSERFGTDIRGAEMSAMHCDRATQ